jgi:hypothetical protein
MPPSLLLPTGTVVGVFYGSDTRVGSLPFSAPEKGKAVICDPQHSEHSIATAQTDLKNFGGDDENEGRLNNLTVVKHSVGTCSQSIQLRYTSLATVAARNL